MRVYGYIKVDTEGYGDGTEARVMVYSNQKDAAEMAYNSYLKELEYALDNDLIDEEDVVNEEDFTEDFVNGLPAGLIQYHDYHVQWEYFEKEVH